MLKNIEYIEINRQKVMISTWTVPFAAPLFLLALVIFRDGGLQNVGADDFIGGIFLSLIFGAIFWIPTILGIILIEFALIRKNANSKTVAISLLLEGIIAFITIWGLFGFDSSQGNDFPSALAFSIAIPQLLRWLHLNRNGRMFNAAEN